MVADLSRIGFGGAPIGGLFDAVDDDVAVAAIDAAWEAGVRIFDTAPLYGTGSSERLFGRALAHRPRHEYRLSTKVGRLVVEGTDGVVPSGFVEQHRRIRWDFSADGVRRSIDDSLQRLGVDHLDTVFVHDPDDFEREAAEGAFPALLALRDEGVIGAVGVGMNQWQMPLRFVRRFPLDVVLLAGRWTVLDRTGEPLMDECVQRGVRVFIGGALNSGVLAAPGPSATFDYAPVTDDVLASALRLQSQCAAAGVPLIAAALQFGLQHPAVDAVLVGMRNPAEVAAAVDNLSVPIPATLWPTLTPHLFSL
jgi:D-threo-aldose 1-dehydrogenase